ncbi:site-specific integrase [Aeromonas sp. NJAU223]|uniref:site-specific integrase n=1 Tax=Aeromonas sp. NJAU223 TaxID=3115650 RepID=UPI003DA8CA73
MKLQIKHFIAQNGERFSLLYNVDHDDPDHAAFPLFYPTAYVTRNLLGQMHSSQVEQLQVIKKLYNWAHQERPALDLHHLLLSRQFLTSCQMDSLAAYLLKKDKKGNTVSRLRYHRSINVAAEYLAWYATEIISNANSPEIAQAITLMKSALNARCGNRQGSTSRQRQAQLTKKLSDEARSTLLNLFQNAENGIKGETQKDSFHRNILALHIMYSTGMRIGEVLGLQLQDFITSSGGEPAYLVVRRNHDAIEDDRIQQPVAKTLNRQLAIDDGLSHKISDYLVQRSKISNVEFHDNSYLLVNFMRGSRQGLGVSIQNFNSSLDRLRKKFPTLSEVHPHLLRHDWNFRFSQKATLLKMNEKEERAAREYSMGWVDDSPSSKIYNRRYIEELAFDIGIRIASDTQKKDL